MNTLFEEFIGRTLQATLQGDGYVVKLQGPRRYALTSVDGVARFATIPDIVVEAPLGHWIIDTKWKRLKGEVDDPKHGGAGLELTVIFTQAFGDLLRAKLANVTRICRQFANAHLLTLSFIVGMFQAQHRCIALEIDHMSAIGIRHRRGW